MKIAVFILIAAAAPIRLSVEYPFYSLSLTRLVKCFFELLTQTFYSAAGTGRKRGIKRTCGRLEAVLGASHIKALTLWILCLQCYKNEAFLPSIA